MRSKPLLLLLQSVNEQSLYPDEILIIDGSLNDETKDLNLTNHFKNLVYYKVEPEHRGLTKQRNYGISKVSIDCEVIFFLDDDTILDSNYFKEIINTYRIFPNALGVGGYINNEVNWEKVGSGYAAKENEFYYDGYVTKEPLRFRLRKKLNLDSDKSPGNIPEYSHARDVSFLPPSGKVYKVEQIMGGVSSFRKEVFEKIKFSIFFEGYGLYEDADFTIRLSKIGDLYLNTNAHLGHYHNPSGRPNLFKYGKMVVRNGWYVWRVKTPDPSSTAIVKWYLITLLLILIRGANVINTNQKMPALQETFGRLVGLLIVMFKKPK